MEACRREIDGERSAVTCCRAVSAKLCRFAPELALQAALTLTPTHFTATESAGCGGDGKRQPEEDRSARGNTGVASASSGQPREVE